MHPKAIVTRTGDTFRSRELRPIEGEERRWIVVRNGRPCAIKRTTRQLITCAMYRGYSVTHEPVFVWKANQ